MSVIILCVIVLSIFKPSGIILNVDMLSVNRQCHYAECRYAQFKYTEHVYAG